MIAIIRMFIFVISCITFLVSASVYIYAKMKLKPKDNKLDDYYYEFEGKHPDVAKYYRITSISFSAAVISMLLMFVALLPFN